jgi:hypothetical protein
MSSLASVPMAAATFAAAVRPSLTNPLALVVGLGGLAMSVTMLLAALSFRAPRPDERPSPAPAPATDGPAGRRPVPTSGRPRIGDVAID